VDLLFQGRLTHQALQEMMASLHAELQNLLAGKADTAAVEAALGQKASVSTLEGLRAEIFALKDALQAGEGIEARLLAERGSAEAQASPFQHYQLEMGALVKQLREEEAAARAQEAAQAEERRKRMALAAAQRGAGATASGGDSAANNAAAADGAIVRMMNADGTPFLPGGGAGGSQQPNASSRSPEEIAREEAERAELRDRLARMEMAIQLANAGGGGGGGGGGAFDMGSGGGDGSGLTLDANGNMIASDAADRDRAAADAQLARLERLLGSKYSRAESQVDELRTKCAKTERDLERLMRAMEQRNRAQALQAAGVGGTGTSGSGGSNSGGGGAASHVQSHELTHLMNELSTLQRGMSNRTAEGKSVYELQLLPAARESAAMIAELRNALREQNRTRTRLLDSLADAKASVSHDVGELFQQVQLLRRRLASHTGSFAHEWGALLREQRAAWQDMDVWKRSVATELAAVLAVAEQSASTLEDLAQPLHAQLQAAETTLLAQHEQEAERRFAAEYAHMRQKYEELRAAEEEAAYPHSQREQEEKQSGGHVDWWSNTHLSSLYSRPFTAAASSPANNHGGDLGPWSAAASPSSRPRTSPLQNPVVGGVDDGALRRASWHNKLPRSLSVVPPDTPTGATSTPRVKSGRSVRVLPSHSGSVLAGDGNRNGLPSPSRWVNPARDLHEANQRRPATCGSSGRALSPSARASPSTVSRAASRAGMLSPASSRPLTGGLSQPSPRSARVATPSHSQQQRFVSLHVEHNDVRQTLALLRERLTMPHLGGGITDALYASTTTAAPNATAPSPPLPPSLAPAAATTTHTFGTPPTPPPMLSAFAASPPSYHGSGSKSSRTVTSVADALSMHRR
jgi:hypothetical protein